MGKRQGKRAGNFRFVNRKRSARTASQMPSRINTAIILNGKRSLLTLASVPTLADPHVRAQNNDTGAAAMNNLVVGRGRSVVDVN